MTRNYKKAAPYYDLTKLARENRKKLTPEETLMWDRLRARRFHGHKIRRQAPLGPYIVDFYCAEKRLVIELDGRQHFTAEGKRADSARDRDLASLGFKVFRFENARIRGDIEGVLGELRSALKNQTGN